MPQTNSEYKNILIIQTAFLGDIILTTPLIINTKKRFPESRVTVLTTPQGSQILEGTDEIDDIISYDKKGADRGALPFFSLLKRLREAHFDLCISPHRSFRTSTLIIGAAILDSVGFSDASLSLIYKRRVFRDTSLHEVERCLSLLEPFGVKGEDINKKPHLAISDSAKKSCAILLSKAGIKQGEPLVAIAPGSVWGTKKWPAENYAALADNLMNNSDIKVLLLGAPADREDGAKIADTCKNKIIDLTGRTSLKELVATIDRCRLLIGNDSAPGHIATARGIPVVSIFGPTIPSFGYVPYGDKVTVLEKDLPCRPCHHHGPPECPEKHFRCMTEISPEEVLRAASQFLPEIAGL
ncbi:MAG: lipopolysaccharide heptosyltransferase II [Proteobacteria bacterium]|nr:lipopolysaccharide heptosyltransferase II [Pseudomonadota bacterium]